MASEKLSEREDPSFWDRQRQAFTGYAYRPLAHYRKFARRFEGDFQEIPYATQQNGDAPGDNPALGNLTNLSTRQARADLYFRNPRFIVKPVGGEGSMFTPLLARIETQLLNDAAIEQGLYRHMRRALLDFLLGPYMVLKVTYDAEIGVDEEEVKSQREAAELEDRAFLAIGKLPRRTDKDNDKVHAEQHSLTIAAAERGEILMPEEGLKYLKKHRDFHVKNEMAGAQSETVRRGSISTRRVNPLNYFFDPFNEDPGCREWAGEVFLARYSSIASCDEYDSKARKELAQIVDADAQIFREAPGRSSQGRDVNTPDPRVRLFEMIDFVGEKVILYGEGCSRPLLVRPYKLGAIMPGGPYIETSSMEDPLNNFGIAPPYIYEAHQQALAAIEGVNLDTCLRSAPKTAFNSNYLDKPAQQKLEEFLVGSNIPLKNLPPGAKIDQIIMQIPPVAIPEQNFAMASIHRRLIEICSGQGSAKLGGGDFSKTATASAIAGESSNTLTEDMAAQVDEHCRRWGVMQIRLMRQFYPLGKVQEIVGVEAAAPGGWPVRFAQRDILADRGVEVIPGSSRRNTTPVETKLLQDTAALVLPLTGTIIPPEFSLDVLRRLLEANGVHGLDWDGALQGMLQMQMAAAGGDPNDPEAGLESGPTPRRAESEDPDMAGQIGATNNVGGGRLMTGASVGDAGAMS